MQHKVNMYYHIVYFVRRLSFVFTAFFMTSNGYFQIATIYYTTLIGIVFLLSTRPYEEPSSTRLELFNEIFVLILLYLTILMYLSIFTIPDSKAGLDLYKDTGMLFSGVLMICLFLNFGRIFCNVLR